MRRVDRWAGVVLTPPWLVVVTLVVAVYTFLKVLKWAMEKVLSTEVGWVHGQGQAVCGLVALDGILVVQLGMLCSLVVELQSLLRFEVGCCSVRWWCMQKAGCCQ